MGLGETQGTGMVASGPRVIKCSQHSSGKEILALLLSRIMRPQGHPILPGAATQDSPGEGRLQAPGQGE